jgi:glycogen phosphorylase
MKVVFVPNFNVTKGEWIYPAAELSEQISMAGKEASGTGNMKFALNGALTIGTLDGANIEIREQVGPENFFLFGLTAENALALRQNNYQPVEFYQKNPELKAALDLIASGHFSKSDSNLFRPLVDSLLIYDPFLVLADYADYIACQDQVDTAYTDAESWTQKSILNTARSGFFSSDRAMRQYCAEIWRVGPYLVK